MPEAFRRPPVVVMMGHVDHGKTSILDRIRDTQLQIKETGGITQSIGAYQVEYQGQTITFIDTPGHEAFAQMRARGGKVADIVVLVVAADDGVMPQTKEAISHAKSAKARMIVALNKIDLESANPNRTKKQLAEVGIELSEYGGNVPLIETSATTGQGISELLDAILTEAKELDLSARVDGLVKGVVIESYLDDKRGPVVDLLMMEGKLQPRDVLVAQPTYARVKSMIDWQGQKLTEVKPGDPVEVLGFAAVPQVGTEVIGVKNLKAAQRWLDENRDEQGRFQQLTARDRIQQALLSQQQKEIRLVVKADSQGALEALIQSIEKLSEDKIKLKVIHQGVGNILESDVLLALPVNGIVIGFNVQIDKNAAEVARREKVVCRRYGIIYELLEELGEVVKGELEAITRQVYGTARVKKVFELSDRTRVAGCEVISGRIKKGDKVDLVRDKTVIGQAKISSLRSGQEAIGEVEEGRECGIALSKPLEFMEGDLIQAVSL